MKKVIREGVFETNSSSTHAVVFKKKKGDSPDNDSSYELHSPFMKTLFFIGLCTHADLYVKDYEEDCEYDLKQTDSNEKVVVEGPKSQCSRFMSALINEYVKMSNITQEEFEKQFNESVFTWDGECQCRNFFDDDVLCDCTCPFDGYYQSAPLNFGSSLYNRLCALGVSSTVNATLTIYAEDRHELLNELNAAEVYQDIFHFLHTHLQ